MKITRLRVSNYRGISTLDAPIPPSGVIARGANGRGKTSVLRSIRAALAANDVGPDAVRIGADKAEIIVDLDDLSVRRAITANGSSVTVTRDGFKAAKPQTLLTELLGTSPLDPLDLFLAPPKERRKQVLAALPVTVTLEQLRAWAPDLPDGTDVSGHGLEVLARVRAWYYDKRHAANATAKAARTEADRLAGTGNPRAAEGLPTVAEAEVALATARRTALEVAARRRACEEHAERTSATREKIDVARRRAAELVPSADEMDASLQACDAAETRVRELQDALRLAKLAHEQALDAHRILTRRGDEADEYARHAADLQEILDEAAPVPVSGENALAAIAAVERADEVLVQARDAERAIEQARVAALAAQAATTAEDAARQLDVVVRTLSDEAPAALLAAANAIPGLGLDGDDIALDGVRLGGLCGAESMYFAVDVARRLNSKTKILVVDGLERLDPEQLELFVRHATRDGYQLIASRVDRGEMVLDAIEADDAGSAMERDARAVAPA